MKKSKILVHLREVVGANISDLSSKTSVPENYIHDMECGIKGIPHKIISYYSSYLHINISVMEALLEDVEKKHYIFEKLQNLILSVLLAYLDLSKWMYSFNEKVKE